MSLKTPCEVIVLCLFGFFIRLYAFFLKKVANTPFISMLKPKSLQSMCSTVWNSVLIAHLYVKC